MARNRGLWNASLSTGDLVGGLVSPFFVFPGSSDDPVGEVPFVSASRFSAGFAFAAFAFEVLAGFGNVALLGDRRDIQDAVDAPVPSKVDSMPFRGTRTFPAGDCDCAGSAPASELRLGRESVRVADLAKQSRSRDRPDTWLVTQSGSVLVE